MHSVHEFDNKISDYDQAAVVDVSLEQFTPQTLDNSGFMNPLSDSNDNDKTKSIDYDQIEVSLVEDKGEPDEVLTNATDFLVENNENYELSWNDAAHSISEIEEDPSKPPVPGWNFDYARFRLRRLVESFYFRIFTMLLIIIDLIIVICDLAIGSGSSGSLSTLQIIDFIITIYFVIEIVLRIVALTHPIFFSTWYNVVDFAVVFCTFIIVCTSLLPQAKWTEALGLLTILRFVRVVRLVRLYTEKMQMKTAARQLVSQNKRRYQQDGFDLDLTYVTARVIATSFPSSGIWSWYRNPIEKMASFLDAKHPGKYKLYNLCSERTYDVNFFHNQVERVLIDDHNVPSLTNMIEFVQSVKTWLNADPENVIVVHCKGGKGRTGTMICVWLVEAGMFSDADQSLHYFGQRRTDTNVGKTFQGVETPSQSRYVGYFEQMKKRFMGQLPPSCKLMLKKIEIYGIMFVGKGDGSDFWFNVYKGRTEKLFSSHIGFKRNCQVDYNPANDILSIDVVNCPILEGDIRILFQTSSKNVPCGYENCPFYFWFNTSFINENTLFLNREQLDNPHKSKTWHCFRPTFAIKLIFDSH